jgi:antitoxin component of MazEF toxin-antitoxin module
MEMLRKILIVGNSLGVTIDTKVVDLLELKQGQLVKINLEIIDGNQTE